MKPGDELRWTRTIDGNTTTILAHIEDDGTFHVDPDALDLMLSDAGWTRA